MARRAQSLGIPEALRAVPGAATMTPRLGRMTCAGVGGPELHWKGSTHARIFLPFSLRWQAA